MLRRPARGDSPRFIRGGGSGDGALSPPSLSLTYEAKRFFADSLGFTVVEFWADVMGGSCFS